MLNITPTLAFGTTIGITPYPLSTDARQWDVESNTTDSIGNSSLGNSSFFLRESSLDLDNKSYTGKHNSSNQQEFGSLEQQIAGIVLLAFAVVAVVLNSAILMATKFTTGGRSPTLIFIRSLCVADILAGTFGIIKHFYIQFGESAKIHLFLGESVMFCSMTASCFVVLGLSWESYIRIARPLEYVKQVQKHVVIGTMVFCWNAAFVFGFSPQIGWSNLEHFSSTKFYEFYAVSYLISLVSAYFVFLFIILVLHLKISALVKQLQKSHHYLTQFSRECRRSIKFVRLTVGNLVILFFSYTPLIVYILLNIVTEFSGFTETIQLYLYPGVLLKSVASPLLNGIHIKQIRHVLVDCCLRLVLRRYAGSSLQHKKFQNSASSSASISIISNKSSLNEHLTASTNGKARGNVYTISHSGSFTDSIGGEDVFSEFRPRSRSFCTSCNKSNPNRLQVSQHRCCFRSVSNGTLQTEVSLSSTSSDISRTLSVTVPENWNKQSNDNNQQYNALQNDTKHHASDNSIVPSLRKTSAPRKGSIDKYAIDKHALQGARSDSAAANGKSLRPRRRVSFSGLPSYHQDSSFAFHKSLASASSNLPLTSNEIIEETPL